MPPDRRALPRAAGPRSPGRRRRSAAGPSRPPIRGCPRRRASRSARRRSRASASSSVANGSCQSGVGLIGPPPRPSKNDSSRCAAASASAGALAPGTGAGAGHPRRQPLVVGLDRHGGALGHRGGERARRGRLLALGPVERHRQADDDQLRALVVGEPGDRVRVRRRDHAQRTDDRPARVADRRPSARFAVVDRQHPHPATSLRERPPDRFARGVERLRQPLGLAAAGLGDVVAPAATTADDGRRLAEHGRPRRARARSRQR